MSELKKTEILNENLKQLGLEKKSIKILLDFIELYKKTENKEILKSLLFDILND